MLRCFFLFLLINSLAISQSIRDEKEFLQNLSKISSDSTRPGSAFNLSYDLLEYCSKAIEGIENDNKDSSQIHLVEYDLFVVQSFSHFFLAGNYLKGNSYPYGIQIFEKGIDNLKRSLQIYDKYPSIISGYDKNKKRLKNLYDFCFNYYCEYKMKKIKDYNLFELIKSNYPDLREIKIFNWILEHLN
jgi:hypothetical protein